jgi:hypothetical protein
MVDLGYNYLQNPPALEQTVGADWADARTIGTQRPMPLQGNGGTSHSGDGSDESKDEVKNSSLSVPGRTHGGGTVVSERDNIRIGETADSGAKHFTVGYSEFVFKRKTAELVSLLNDLKPNLQVAEGAAIMTSFRNSLEQIWTVAGPLPREKVIVVSAVEESVRNTKWRELSVGQIDVLQRLLTDETTGGGVPIVVEK